MSGCSVHTLPSVLGKFISWQPKLAGPNSEKNHELSDREECQKFQLLVVQLLGSQFVDEDEGDGFPVTLNERTASRFEDRLDNRARRFFRMLVLLVVAIVDHEELVYILVESCPHVSRAFICILVLFEQNQVVVLVVVEHCLDSIRVPNVLYSDFFQVLLRRMSGPPRQSCHVRYLLLGPPDEWQRTIFVLFVPSLEYGLRSSMLGLTSFLLHFLSLLIHSLSLRRSMFGTANGVIFDNLDWIW